MKTDMRIALVVALSLLGGAAVAQEGQPPAVTFEAPVQNGAPAAESAEIGLPEATAAPEVVSPPAITPAAPQAGEGGATSENAAPVTPVTPPAAGEGEPEPVAPAALPSAASSTSVSAAPAPQGIAGHNVELSALFWQAHWVVQAVMAGLALAAFVTLVIFIQKLAEYAMSFAAMRRAAAKLASAKTLQEAAGNLSGTRGPAAEMILAAAEEFRLAEAEPALIPGVRERSQAALQRIEAGMAQRLRAGTGILASVGSLSPFVGLFGTVFGIMNSFIAIAETKTTNLAVVAPGIAEALLATAIGLAAAIPAVLIYNICARRLAKYRHQLNDIGAAALRLQSRELDRLAARV